MLEALSLFIHQAWPWFAIGFFALLLHKKVVIKDWRARRISKYPNAVQRFSARLGGLAANIFWYVVLWPLALLTYSEEEAEEYEPDNGEN